MHAVLLCKTGKYYNFESSVQLMITTEAMEYSCKKWHAWKLKCPLTQNCPEDMSISKICQSLGGMVLQHCLYIYSSVLLITASLGLGIARTDEDISEIHVF